MCGGPSCRRMVSPGNAADTRASVRYERLKMDWLGAGVQAACSEEDPGGPRTRRSSRLSARSTRAASSSPGARISSAKARPGLNRLTGVFGSNTRASLVQPAGWSGAGSRGGPWRSLDKGASARKRTHGMLTRFRWIQSPGCGGRSHSRAWRSPHSRPRSRRGSPLQWFGDKWRSSPTRPRRLGRHSVSRRTERLSPTRASVSAFTSTGTPATTQTSSTRALASQLRLLEVRQRPFHSLKNTHYRLLVGYIHLNLTNQTYWEMSDQLPSILPLAATSVYSPAVLPQFKLELWTTEMTNTLATQMASLNAQGVTVWLRFGASSLRNGCAVCKS